MLMIAATVWSSGWKLGTLSLLAGVFSLVCRLQLRKLLWGLLPIASLVAGTAVLAAISGMRFTDIRFALTLKFAAKCWIVYSIGAGLLACTHYADAISALERLRIPALFTAVAASICRWFDVVRVEAMNANTARILRGGDNKKRLAQIGDLAIVASCVMSRSYLRAERVAAAMECRGFSGKLVRLPSQPLTATDFILPMVGAAALSIIWLFVP